MITRVKLHSQAYVYNDHCSEAQLPHNNNYPAGILLFKPVYINPEIELQRTDGRLKDAAAFPVGAGFDKQPKSVGDAIGSTGPQPHTHAKPSARIRISQFTGFHVISKKRIGLHIRLKTIGFKWISTYRRPQPPTANAKARFTLFVIYKKAGQYLKPYPKPRRYHADITKNKFELGTAITLGSSKACVSVDVIELGQAVNVGR